MTTPDDPPPLDGDADGAAVADPLRVHVRLEVVPHLAALVAHDRGVRRMPAPVRDEVRRAGLVGDDGTPPPGVQLIAETLAATLVEIDVQVATPGGLVTALAFVSPAGAVLVRPDHRQPSAPEDLVEVSLHPAAEIPYRLAELLDLGARPHAPEAPAIRLPAGVLDELLGVPAEEADAALTAVFGGEGGLPADVLTTVRDLVRDARARWSGTAQVVVDDDRAARRGHEVLDAGPSGWWQVLRDDRSEVLVPTTGRDVLGALESLLPTDDELRQLTPSPRPRPEGDPDPAPPSGDA